MGGLVIDEQNQTVRVRGITFPVDHIRAAMIETGGIVVANNELNEVLDRALYNHIRSKDKEPEMLIIEAEPGIVFIPKKVTLQYGSFGLVKPVVDNPVYLYFATRKKYHG